MYVIEYVDVSRQPNRHFNYYRARVRVFMHQTEIWLVDLEAVSGKIKIQIIARVSRNKFSAILQASINDCENNASRAVKASHRAPEESGEFIFVASHFRRKKIIFFN